jgi:histidinol dehydrogenase
MSREKLADWSHPILGIFERSTVKNHLNETFFDLEKKGQTVVADLRFTFDQFTISLREVSEPPSEMLSDLTAMVEWPKARIDEIEDRLLGYYEENRPRYLEEHEENGIDADEIARGVPAIKRRDQIWQLIERPFYINGGTWEYPSMAFECIFDIEHELHISFANGRIHDVWNE